jgi:hypothetical protein
MKKKEYIKLEKYFEKKLSTIFYTIVHALDLKNKNVINKKRKKSTQINESILTPKSLNETRIKYLTEKKNSSNNTKNSSNYAKNSKIDINPKKSSSTTETEMNEESTPKPTIIKPSNLVTGSVGLKAISNKKKANTKSPIINPSQTITTTTTATEKSLKNNKDTTATAKPTTTQTATAAATAVTTTTTQSATAAATAEPTTTQTATAAATAVTTTTTQSATLAATVEPTTTQTAMAAAMAGTVIEDTLFYEKIDKENFSIDDKSKLQEKLKLLSKKDDSEFVTPKEVNTPNTANRKTLKRMASDANIEEENKKNKQDDDEDEDQDYKSVDSSEHSSSDNDDELEDEEEEDDDDDNNEDSSENDSKKEDKMEESETCESPTKKTHKTTQNSEKNSTTLEHQTHNELPKTFFSPPKNNFNREPRYTIRISDKSQNLKRDNDFFTNVKKYLTDVKILSTTDDQKGNIYVTVKGQLEANIITNSANFYPNLNKKILDDKYATNRSPSKSTIKYQSQRASNSNKDDDHDCILLGISMKHIEDLIGLKEILKNNYGIMSCTALANHIDKNSKAVKVKCMNEALATEAFNTNQGNMEIKYKGESHRVRLVPVIKPIKQCKQCGYLDHWTDQCNTTPLCTNCCNLAHEDERECRNPPHCINCAGAHSAFDKVNCLDYRSAQKIARNKEIKRRTIAYNNSNKKIVNIHDNYQTNSLNTNNRYTEGGESYARRTDKTAYGYSISNPNKESESPKPAQKNMNNASPNIDENDSYKEKLDQVEMKTNEINKKFNNIESSIIKQIESTKSLIEVHNASVIQTNILNESITKLIKDQEKRYDQNLEANIKNPKSKLNTHLTEKIQNSHDKIIEYVNKNFAKKTGPKVKTATTSSDNEHSKKATRKSLKESKNDIQLRNEEREMIESYKNGTAQSQIDNQNQLSQFNYLPATNNGYPAKGNEIEPSWSGINNAQQQQNLHFSLHHHQQKQQQQQQQQQQQFPNTNFIQYDGEGGPQHQAPN